MKCLFLELGTGWILPGSDTHIGRGRISPGKGWEDFLHALGQHQIVRPQVSAWILECWEPIPTQAALFCTREIWGAAPSSAHCSMPPCQRQNQGVLTYSAVSHKDRLDRWQQNVRSVSDSFINLLQTLVDFERNHIDSSRGCTVAFICKISMGRSNTYLPANCPDWKAFSSPGCFEGVRMKLSLQIIFSD